MMIFVAWLETFLCWRLVLIACMPLVAFSSEEGVVPLSEAVVPDCLTEEELMDCL